jgi:hypothetical protein
VAGKPQLLFIIIHDSAARKIKHRGLGTFPEIYLMRDQEDY